jgi:DNA-binding transcriptional ArsR family regulator
MKPTKPLEADLRAIGDLDRLVHEPARLMIMALLYVIESADFTFLMSQTGLTWGNLSSHLSKLEAGGYIEVEKEFVERKPHTMLHLTEAGRQAFLEYRRSIVAFLDDLPD